MSFRAGLASVPAWAPIGHDPAWYRCHLGEPVPDARGHPTPMVEVLAHHRERWGHVATFEEFLPLLTFGSFDPDAWAQLAVEAGAAYVIVPALTTDGLYWWDAPGATRSVLGAGPRRDVLADLATALGRAGLVVGAKFESLDEPDRVESQVLDLVERHGVELLAGDSSGRDPGDPATQQVVERIRRANPRLVLDEYWAPAGGVVVHEARPPDAIVHRPWELRRGLGSGVGHNRAERAEHLLSARGVVALLTEVIAKGGNLVLDVGPDADGTISEVQARPMREAGTWARRHADTLDASVPWDVWGDETVRYVVSAGHLGAIDVAGFGTFEALGRGAGRVTDVRDSDGAALHWEQGDDVLRVRRLDRSPTGLAAVYRVSLDPHGEAPVPLFAPIAPPTPPSLAALVSDVRAGHVVQLGDGTYAGPVVVPTGVTVRGLGAHRTVIESTADAAVTLSTGASLEHVTVRGSDAPVAIVGADATLLGCDIEGRIDVTGRHARLRACRASGVAASGADQVTVTRCHLDGARDAPGVVVVGGAGHLIDSNELTGHRCAIHLDGTVGAVVRGNVVEATWWGVRLERTDASTVVGNAVSRTARAVDVDGGTSARVEGNAIYDGDSGCIVQAGASDVAVSGNRWERCRTGLLAWDAGVVRHHDNAAIDVHEPDHTITIGPA